MNQDNLIIKSQELGDYNYILTASLGGKPAGEYWFYNTGDEPVKKGDVVIGGAMKSFFSERDIPGALLKEATKFLQEIATTDQITLEHHVVFILKDLEQKEKLIKLYTDFDYSKVEDGDPKLKRYFYVRAYKLK